MLKKYWKIGIYWKSQGNLSVQNMGTMKTGKLAFCACAMFLEYQNLNHYLINFSFGQDEKPETGTHELHINTTVFVHWF